MRKILVFALCCITHGLFAQWQTIYNDIYNTNYGNVGIRTVYPQTALNIYFGPGDATTGTGAFRVGGSANYPSLELGIKGAYDGMISTYGNDLHIYAGNWRVAGATASEDHSISFYTSQSGSSNWNTAKMFLRHDGNLGIGTTSPDSKLTVKGTIHAQEIKVDLNFPGPDYVFEPGYKLLSLSEIEKYILHHKHLPDVPSAKELEADGVNVVQMNMLLLRKVEELTIHLIETEKKMAELQNELGNLKNRRGKSIKK